MLAKKKEFFPRSFQQKPANFVLLRCHYDEYVVIPRKGAKSEYFALHHFVGFFTHEEDGWRHAQDKVKMAIIQREGQLAYLKKKEREVGRG